MFLPLLREYHLDSVSAKSDSYHFLSLFKIPILVHKNIKSLLRNLLWEEVEEGWGSHMVRWEVFFEADGGLGIGNIT